MFEIQRVLTNTRPKNEVAELFATPTKGIIKLTETAAVLVGLRSGDYASIAEAKTDEGVELFVFKGRAGDKDNGVSQLGAKCDFTNGGDSGSMQFSSGNVWNLLKGDSQNNTKYSVSTEGVESNGTTYYKLTFVGKTPKSVKKATSEAKSNDLGAVIEETEIVDVAATSTDFSDLD